MNDALQTFRPKIGAHVRADEFHLTTEIIVWAEPLVRDRLTLFWSREARESDVVRGLADLHWRMWRSALSNLPHGARAMRRDLAHMAVRAGSSADAIALGDEAVIDEIADVIVARFRRSPAFAKDCTKALIRAAANLLNQPTARAA